jgi:serine protease Do
MNRFLRKYLFFCTAITFAAFSLHASSSLPDFTELAEKNSPTVVNIKATPKKQEVMADNPQGVPFNSPFGQGGGLPDFFRYFYDEQQGNRKKPRKDARPSQGSGFIISQDGYIITNHHVVDGAGELIVTLSDRSELVAELIGSDERSDIAVLKIDAPYELRTVQLGDSDSLKVGEWVLAIGSPFGFDYSVTAGIVSAKSRSLPDDNYVPFIQTDVAINPGNSGGPLFNLQGEVVGVNSQIYSRTGGFMGLSFAIPMKVVLNVYEQIKQNGSVSRGWLGVFIQDVTQELAESFGMTKPGGALISKVLPDSPAKKGGIKPGDIIIEFGGSVVDRSSDLPPLVGQQAVDSKVVAHVIRNGKKLRLTITIGALKDNPESFADNQPKREDKAKIFKKIGIGVTQITSDERIDLKVEHGGVLVSNLENGPASEAGIEVGDVILKMASSLVLGVESFESILRPLKLDSIVPILIQRGGSPLYVAVRLAAVENP